jgi:hypothetical protein
MTGNEEKSMDAREAVPLIGLPAQLYEFHEVTEESKGFGLSLWLRPLPPRIILVAAPDMKRAITYLEAHMPDFQIRTVTPRGAVLAIVEHGIGFVSNQAGLK